MATQWLVTGAGGQLGSVLLGMLARRGAAAVGTASRNGPRPIVGDVVPIDFADASSISTSLKQLRPQFIVHAAAMTSVNECFHDPDKARRVNVVASQRLAELAAELNARLVFISTDLVFDGSLPPYSETDDPRPLSVYGHTKREAEMSLQNADRAVVLRLPLMYGIPAVKRDTTFTSQLHALSDRRELPLFYDEFRTPLWLEDAARSCIDVARSDVTGVLHAGGPERLSRLEMIEIAARAYDIDDPRIRSVSQSEISLPETRPPDVSLDSTRFEAIFHRPPGIPMTEAMAEIAQARPKNR